MLLLEILVNIMYASLIRMLGSTAELDHLVNAISRQIPAFLCRRSIWVN